MVSTSRSKNEGQIWEHWLVQPRSKTLCRRNHMLKKLMERLGRIVLSPLVDRVYICNKIKLNYTC